MNAETHPFAPENDQTESPQVGLEASVTTRPNQREAHSEPAKQISVRERETHNAGAQNAMVPYEPLPHNLDIEQQLLGNLLTNNETFYNVHDILKAEHFYNAGHGRLYDVMSQMIIAGKQATPITMRGFADIEPEFDETGGVNYLIRLAAGTAALISTRDYAEHIIADYTRRELIGVSDGIRVDAQAHDVDAYELIDAAEEALHQLRPDSNRADHTPIDMATMFDRTLKQIEDTHENKGMLGVTTGLKRLDTRLGGFKPSRLYILAGRPGMGKTAMAVVLSKNAAERSGKGVINFSLEMQNEELGTRTLVSMAAVLGHKIQYRDAENGTLSYEERQILAEMAKMQRSLPMYSFDRSGITVGQIRLMAMRKQRELEKRDMTLGVIFIDYLQLIRPDSRYSGNKNNEVGEITAALKTLAKELKIAVVALSQLSREVEKREDKRPIMSDLRDSGNIEQDADAILYVYRHSYYLAKQEPAEGTGNWDIWEAEMEACQNQLQIITAKQRSGPEGIDTFYADMATNFIGDLHR